MKSRSCWATGELETLSTVPHSTHITSSSMSGSDAACGRGEREHDGERGEQLHAFSASSFGRCSSSHSCVTGKRRIAAIRPWRSIRNVSG